jgi:hypothetical protein
MRNRISFRGLGSCALWIAVMLVGVSGAWAEDSSAEQKVAAIKQSLQSSMAALRSYEWVETVTVKVDGEQKSVKESQCYYGADGKQEKVVVSDSSAGKKMPRGLRGRIAKKKKEEMDEYVHAAMALVKGYIPPDPARLQAIKDQGAQRIEVLDNASRLRADYPAYLKKGDMLAVDIDPKADRILGISVSSYLEDDPEDVVKLKVTFGTFQDGTSYPAKIDLDGQSKKVEIVIENHGYHKP